MLPGITEARCCDGAPRGRLKISAGRDVDRVAGRAAGRTVVAGTTRGRSTGLAAAAGTRGIGVGRAAPWAVVDGVGRVTVAVVRGVGCRLGGMTLLDGLKKHCFSFGRKRRNCKQTPITKQGQSREHVCTRLHVLIAEPHWTRSILTSRRGWETVISRR